MPGELVHQDIDGQRAQHELADQDERDQGDRVQEVARERRRLPGVDEVLQRERRREIEADRIGAGVERRPECVGERQEPEQPERPRADGVQHPPRRAKVERVVHR